MFRQPLIRAFETSRLANHNDVPLSAIGISRANQDEGFSSSISFTGQHVTHQRVSAACWTEERFPAVYKTTYSDGPGDLSRVNVSVSAFE